MRSDRKTRWILSSALLVFYTLSYFVSPALGFPIRLVYFLATMGVLIAVTLFLGRLPLPYYLAVVIYGFFAQYLGTMWRFYDFLPWWDLLMHLASGAVLGAFGTYLYRFLARKDPPKNAVWLPVLFSVFFSLACAGVWEIYEYCLDSIGGFGSQLGLDDTMEDILCGVIGGLGYGIFLFLRLRKMAEKDPD